MELYLLRHAIAAEPGTAAYPDDRLRPLTPKGKSKMVRIAKGMKAMKLSFDLMISSPYLRAKQTAEIVVKVFKAKKLLEFSDALIPAADPIECVNELKRAHADARSIILIGHEPFLSHLTSLLWSGNTHLPLDFKKGGLCKLEIGTFKTGSCATLCWLLTPRQLIAIGS